MGDSQAHRIRHYPVHSRTVPPSDVSSLILPSGGPLQFELIGYFRCDVLKGNRRSRDSLEADSVQRQPRQFAYFHLPLHQAVLPGIAVDAEEQKPLLLFVIAVVCI